MGNGSQELQHCNTICSFELFFENKTTLKKKFLKKVAQRFVNRNENVVTLQPKINEK